MTSQFADITSSSNFLDVVMIVLLGLVTGPSFRWISWVVWSYDSLRLQKIGQKSKYPHMNFPQ